MARPSRLGTRAEDEGARGEGRAGAEHPAGARAFSANEVQHFINPFTLRDGAKTPRLLSANGRVGG